MAPGSAAGSPPRTRRALVPDVHPDLVVLHAAAPAQPVVATGLRWQGWGSPTATASGTFLFNAAPHTSETAVRGKLVATGLEDCGQASYYTSTRLQFDERPPFQPQVPRLRTPCG
jgi:hypothetical protein